MRDAHRRHSETSTESSGHVGTDTGPVPETLLGAYLASPVGGGFRAELKRARKLTPVNGLRKAARVAVAASALLAGRPDRGCA